MQSFAMRRSLVLGGVAALTAAALWGCTATTGVEEAATAPAPSTSTAAPSSATPVPADTATAAPAPASEAPAALDTEAAPDTSSAAQTIELAMNAVTAFCRPTLDYDTWINELYPFLSQRAAVAYETVYPANVPCTAVTGDARVRDGDEAYTMRILVPTDAGEYSIYVHRPVDTAPWAVEQIIPLASE